MILPSNARGRTTTTVGYFETKPADFASWLLEGLGERWHARFAESTSIDELLAEVAPHVPLDRNLLMPIGDWTILLNNGPLGTDVGVLGLQIR